MIKKYIHFLKKISQMKVIIHSQILIQFLSDI